MNFLSLLLIGVDGPDRPVPAEEDISRVVDDFEYENEYDAFEFSPPDDNVELENQPSTSNDSFDV